MLIWKSDNSDLNLELFETRVESPRLAWGLIRKDHSAEALLAETGDAGADRAPVVAGALRPVVRIVRDVARRVVVERQFLDLFGRVVVEMMASAGHGVTSLVVILDWTPRKYHRSYNQ